MHEYYTPWGSFKLNSNSEIHVTSKFNIGDFHFSVRIDIVPNEEDNYVVPVIAGALKLKDPHYLDADTAYMIACTTLNLGPNSENSLLAYGTNVPVYT